MSVDGITHSTIFRQDIINLPSDVHDDTAAGEVESAHSVSKCRKEEEEKKPNILLLAGAETLVGEIQLEAKTGRQYL